MYFSLLKAESRFEIIPTENGFDLWERILLLFTPIKLYKTSNVQWHSSGSGTEITVEISTPKTILITRLLIGTLVVIIPAYFLFLIVGFASFLWPFFIYFASMLSFSFRVWQIEDLVIHKICGKKVKKLGA